MKDFRYIANVSTLKLDQKKCTGCRACTSVCPHEVFSIINNKAVIQDADACMECGACALNCPFKAVSVKPGVGCAGYIIKAWIIGPDKASCGCC